METQSILYIYLIGWIIYFLGFLGATREADPERMKIHALSVDANKVALTLIVLGITAFWPLIMILEPIKGAWDAVWILTKKEEE